LIVRSSIDVYRDRMIVRGAAVCAQPDGIAIRTLTWTYDNEGLVQYVTGHTDTIPDTSA